jgi:hypothetical protein
MSAKVSFGFSQIGHSMGGPTMWRLYVGGLLTGFAIGGSVVWVIALTMIPTESRPFLPGWMPLLLLPFVLAGENLRVKAKSKGC